MDTPRPRYREGAMRTAGLMLLALAACKGAPQEEVARPPPPPPPVRPPDLVQAKVTLGCLFDRARYPRDVLGALKEAAPPVLRMAALAAIDRARRDGESPAEVALADAIDAFVQVDDLDGLRQAFALVDAIPNPPSQLFGHDAGARARVGLVPKAADAASDRAVVVRELALAANLPEATKLFAAIERADIDDAYEQEPYLGALVALGRVADAKALIAKQKPEDRFKLTGAWLDVALRQRAPLTEGLAAALAELAVAPERALSGFPERTLLQRAVRVGRAAELAPLYRVLLPRLTADGKNPGLADLAWAFAVAAGDTATATKLAADPALAAHVAVRAGPLDTALAAALANKFTSTEDLVRVWARSIEPGVDAAFGARLQAAVCPKPSSPRGPATSAAPGLTLTVTEKPRKKQFQCANHDLVVRLERGATVVGEEVVPGECHGPCTAAEQREGRARLAEIEKAIEEGTASESETDYNFTECMFAGANVGRTETVGGRAVAVIVNHYIGAHDIDKDSYLLALEVCGELHLTTTFGGMYAGSFGLADLKLRAAGDEILVEVASDRWRGVVFRLTLPACPGKPEEQVLETE